MYSKRLEQQICEKGRIEIKRGDEVCAFDNKTGNLVCGIANHSHYCEITREKIWSVRWVSHVDRLFSSTVMDCDIMPTDRLIYKGSKVRSLVNNDGAIKTGTCRSVIYHADLRVVGTRTIITRVNMDDFKHLKDYNQHSVVHYNGWLGVISEVTRMAEIIKPGGKKESTWVSLNSIIGVCPLGRESPMIGEVPNSKSKVLLKNLKIISVTVDWHHQVDSNFPDKPRNKFDGSHSKLQLVKEDTSIELLELGSLGRYEIKDDTELCSWENWQQKFAKKYYPKVVNKLYNKNENVAELDKTLKAARCYDEENFSKSIQERGVKSGDTFVVELVHLNSTPDIQWQDGTSEIPSSLELEVVNENLMASLNCLVPGDFIYSQQLDYKSDDAFFVLLSESESSDGRKLVCHVLDANVPGKVLQYNATIDANPISLSKRVVRHPLYQYFNEMNTIVVVNEDFESNHITIGHVIGTNLMGKVNVRCIDRREKWFWPQNCAIYTARGFDLECIKSHVTDCENEVEPERKLRNILDLLKERVELVWKNNSMEESDLKESFSNLEKLYCSFQNIVQRLADFPHINVDSNAYLELKLFLQNTHDNNITYRTSELTNLVLNAVKDLFKKGESILSELTQNITSDNQMDVDISSDINLSGISAIETELEKMFSNTIHILDTHPSHHHYANWPYKPQNHKLFLKTLKEELVRIEKMCAPEMKTEMGILVRTYNDRMDLFSILIRGPVGTPYEDSLYLFDALLPSNYPNEPPKFHFHSFRAGRLNPNLYDEGKVCVSLLGTWQGKDQRENWTKDSNIVQILLSIQALILVKSPYHNEPGQEASKYTKQLAKKHNLDYNHQLMPMIINMMINQINFGSNLDPWQEILRIFYKNHIPIFIARWRKWLAVTSELSLNQENRPGFELYPLNDYFIVRMTSSIAKLENLYTSKLNV